MASSEIYRDLIFASVSSFAYSQGGCTSPLMLLDSYSDAQPIYAYPNSNDLFIAGSIIGLNITIELFDWIQIFNAKFILGKGKILVEGYLGFLYNLNSKTTIMANVRKWLASSARDITPAQIIDLGTVEITNPSLASYKIVTWNLDFTPQTATLSKLLLFVNNGGKILFQGV